MKIAVRYYTKSGNTKRLAEAVAEAKLAAISEKKPEKKEHTVTIRIIETHKDDKVPFYLVSFITA